LDGVYSALARIPTFRDVRLETVELEPLGSLTNSTYKVTANGLAYTLRVPGKDTDEYVDRAAEEHNARIMAAAGVNAKVLYFDATDGTMLSEFVEGVNMTETRFRDEPEAPARVALALKRVHRLGPVFRSRFDVVAMIDVYLGILRKLGAPLPEDYHEVEQGARAVRWALDASPMPLSPCHNDPWPGNLLDAGGRLYIIDWEFSGMNDPMWDLGDLSVEAGFEPEQDRVMIEAYYGATAPLALYSRLALYKALSDLLWALWGLIQHANDNPRNDFLTYALGRLGRCKALMGSTEFGRHVNAV
jgi:thiamine kinase-like enzyme